MRIGKGTRIKFKSDIGEMKRMKEVTHIMRNLIIYKKPLNFLRVIKMWELASNVSL
jgi:hypothetical protein